ncbi:MAG: LysR family transcriptional regulator [Alphaproteobacteria bacterium]
MDRLQAMSVFVAVAEEAGFAPAARRLNLSPPSVTRAIAALEARLGCRLLHRTTRTLKLTEVGARYVADCRRLLAAIEESERHAAGLHAAPKGEVSVTASVLFGRMIVAPALLDLLDRYAGLRLTAQFVDRVVRMQEDGIDVAVRIAELPDSSLTAVRVGQVRRVLCAAPGYLDERGRPQAPDDLDGHQVLDFTAMTPGGAWRFETGNRRQSFRPKARFRVNNADAALAAARAGRGITRVLSYMIADDLAAGRLELVLEDQGPPPVPVYVVHKEPGRTTARVRAVVDHLVEALRNNPALG